MFGFSPVLPAGVLNSIEKSRESRHSIFVASSGTNKESVSEAARALVELVARLPYGLARMEGIDRPPRFGSTIVRVVHFTSVIC